MLINRYAIVTLVVGEEAEKMAIIAIPFMKEYARKIDAELIVLGQSKISQELGAHFEKFQIYNLLKKYDRIIYLDIDIIVTPWARNLFSIVNAGKLGVISVEDLFKNSQREKGWLDEILGPINWDAPYFNSGVIVADKSHIEIFNADDGLTQKWVSGKEKRGINALNDQSILNYRANKYKIPYHSLKRTYNFTRVSGNFHQRFIKDIIHYAGQKGNRTKPMRRDAERIRNKHLIHFLRKHPWVTYILDRISALY